MVSERAPTAGKRKKAAPASRKEKHGEVRKRQIQAATPIRGGRKRKRGPASVASGSLGASDWQGACEVVGR